MSSSELTDRTAAVIAALIGLGLRPDDRVLVMLADGPGFAEVFAGVTKLGAVALPVNPQLSAADVVAIAAQTGARLVVGSAERNQGFTTDLETTSLVAVDGSRGLWAAGLRLR
jgi:acyl-CoA synthetase (AMP-forming)/AMP-acid ligase II